MFISHLHVFLLVNFWPLCLPFFYWKCVFVPIDLYMIFTYLIYFPSICDLFLNKVEKNNKYIKITSNSTFANELKILLSKTGIFLRCS